MYILPYELIEDLTDQMLTDYFETQRFPLQKIDIDAFATDYLKLNIKYDRLNYGGETVLAITTHRDSVIGLPERNPVVFKQIQKDTVLLDTILSAPEREAQRAFTLAHECGHHCLAMLRLEEDTAGNAVREFFGTPEQELWYWEWQANIFASTLLMPRYLVECMQLIIGHPQKFVIYDDVNVMEDEKQYLFQLAETLGVSYRALLYRLKKLKLVEQRSYEEYLDILSEMREEDSFFGSFYNRTKLLCKGSQRARPAVGGILVC